MSYPYPADIVTIADELVSRIKVAAPGFVIPVDPALVFYGDQDRIPKTPAICVETGDKNRDLAGVPSMTENQFNIYILVYHNKVQGNQTTRRDVDRLAYAIEHMLHQDLQLRTNPSDPNSGLLIHGFVTNTEFGYTTKVNTLYRSARLTFFGKNKTSLPTA